MHTIIIDPFAIIVDHAENDRRDTPLHYTLSSEFIGRITHEHPDSSDKFIQIIFKITEEYNDALTQCNWNQVYNYIQRIKENIRSLDSDYMNITLPISWMNPSQFKKSLINELSILEGQIKTQFLDPQYQTITTEEIQQLNGWMSKADLKNKYHIKKSYNKPEDAEEKDVSDTFHEENTALRKYLLHQGYLHELITTAKATFKEQKQNSILVVGFFENCSTLLTSTPETYKMVREWLSQTEKATNVTNSKLDPEYQRMISLARSNVMEFLSYKFELADERLETIRRILSESRKTADYLRAFDVDMADIIDSKVTYFESRTAIIIKLKKTCKNNHQKMSIIGLTRLLGEDIDTQRKHLYIAIDSSNSQVESTLQLLNDHSLLLENSTFFGKTLTDLTKDLDATQKYLSQTQSTTREYIQPGIIAARVNTLSTNIKATITIIDIKNRLTDLSNIFSLCSYFAGRPKYADETKTKTINYKTATERLLGKCNRLLHELGDSEAPLSHQEMVESYLKLSQSLLDFINQQSPKTPMITYPSLPFKTYISKLLRGSIHPLHALTDPDIVILDEILSSTRDAKKLSSTRDARGQHSPTLFFSSSHPECLSPTLVNLRLTINQSSSEKLPSSQAWIEHSKLLENNYSPTSVAKTSSHISFV